MSTEALVFEELIGKRAISVTQSPPGDPDEVNLVFSDGSRCKLFHEKDCCESVDIVDVVGELSDLVDSMLVMAEVVTQDGAAVTRENGVPDYGSTWSYYKFATIKGSVTISWRGESNGYYSEKATVEITNQSGECKSYFGADPKPLIYGMSK
jgi:hypothetical protein